MKKFSKKYLKFGMAAMMGVGILATSGMTTYASNDNHGFSFKLKPNHANSYSHARYRQTSDTNNKWKVNLTYNSEGKGTAATFWLTKNQAQVSKTKYVLQGNGPYYTTAYETASKSNVSLTAENNNYSPTTYSVSGYWDEEIN